MRDVFIVDAVRTPRGRGKAGKGALSGVHPQELLAQTLNRLAEKTGIRKDDVEDVVVGCVTQAGEQGACVARTAILAAGWPDGVTGVTVNRFCGSGAQAVNFAAMGVMSGQQEVAVGGGVESMSRVPMGSDGAPLDGNNLALRKKLAMVPQGISADLIATIEGFSREDVDRFALESQHKAERAAREGRFAKSLFTVVDLDGKPLLDRDEHPRAGATIEALAKLEPAFAGLGSTPMGPAGETVDELARLRYPQVTSIEHVHTAGNSSGIVDGAAVVLLASGDYVKAHGLRPRARLRATATAGAEPVIMLTAPAPASERALKKAGMQARDIDLWEINEAFAAVPLQTARKLGIDLDRVNVNGGAIALGHPLGATGACLVGTALDELERADKATALITLCIGGGMGVATIIERV
ncbi:MULTISPECIES: acetyl-CoA C-acetyltransferase [Sorangium]|uniref:Acetyl-CoA acetyltransferase n=1 Tax=Sorangium cellulosum TaxID=56 RepID=A0A4V0NHK0_SORCE|nr:MULTISPECIES: acetyl-CoA C-acetyltransferase [Sorangium]AUX36942.1 acetyl-CoA acetyltransferase [Sorangium cellulosum]WCQ96236.1 Putative acyltransferase [Sorangium sp. Soce836]